MNSVNDIRRAFLDYFVKHEHKEVPSSSLVPLNDPTLMFTNAGMVQFKNAFTGLEKRDYTRAVTSQKCVRAGGKHNDLENVGYTARHHTFFEMLGNFSFGDYFKEEAIFLAWHLITKEFGLDSKKLLVTVYSEDDEAAVLWKKIAGLKDDDIIRISTSDNFWSMGETGPCGPCSEIFYDHGDHIPGGPPGSPDEDGDRFIEIWNLVFMQFEQISADKRNNLPRPSIDTGMGLERIAAVLQGTHDNYEIDLFQTLIGASVELTGVKAEGKFKASHSVIADHLRASSFLMADGVLPSNEGRGYVLRRIMRRAMRHAHLLGAKDPLLSRLYPTLLGEMGEAYPELHRAKALISDTLEREEIRFRETLARGLKLLEDETKGLKKGDELSGQTAFKLYDTYGFPLDLTQDALKPRGVGVDTDGFDTAMERQRAEARKAWSGSGDAATESLWFDSREKVGPTDFLGYEHSHSEGQVKQLIKNGKEVASLKEGDEGQVILNQTVFYGESGGQVGDTGVIKVEGGLFEVTDTKKKLGDLFVHYGRVAKGQIKVGDEAHLEVNQQRRNAIRANHSATHLVHEALRLILGDHVSQKGSLVSDQRLRFDFSHPKPMDDQELAKVEQLVNEIILQNEPVVTRLMAVDDAVEEGAMALFGEKYGDEVRVVTMGTYQTDLEEYGIEAGKTYSMELCGGIHVERTGDIGLCTLVSEGAVASGVRRIEAFTAGGARAYLSGQDKSMRTISDLLNAPNDKVAERISALMDERKKLERDLREAKKQLAMGGGAAGQDDEIEQINGVGFLGKVLEGIEAKDLRSFVDEGKKTVGSGIVVMACKSGDGKAGVAVGVTDDLVGTYSAVELVRLGSSAVGGKGGGGRDDLAQAGGPNGDKASDVLTVIKSALAS